ncbi:Arginase/deacetylase [Aspergillus ellipticus CBS 707.79]|uniref:Arginase/deacetylase n=1 Tax=Aspergillus ellipticus CBS 707.79 TaxID=1448320 RepID=A0A319DIT6_9EURO|nr:Arginase/deacetylase [Aspergillus ellipticus CBS 707.79]
MDPSQRDDPASFTAPVASMAASPPTDLLPDPPLLSSHRLSHPPSPPVASSSLLSPADPPARSVANSAHPAPRRIPSPSALSDERRKSSPSLKKRSSTASLRSNRGASTSPRPSLSRHSSSSTFGTSPTSASAAHHNMSSKKPPLAATKEHSVPTAASIAAGYFRREVDWHQSAGLQSQTLVLVHDACYGHRFSRPRASRAALNSIVERPERVQAGVLGISAAYVRLARRHAGGRFAPNPDLDPYHLPVPPFQIRKTTRTLPLFSPAVTHVHGAKWMEELKAMCDAAESRLALNGKELTRPRSAGKDGAAANAPVFHEGDLYLCSESLNAFEGALGGVSDGVDAVLGPGPTKRAFVCIRPPGHHCSAGHPSGFCWINNVHVGISYAAMNHGLTHAAILDFDLHHGDGSQDIAWEQNHKAVTAPRNAAAYRKTMVGYFSLHDINSYPCEMGEPEKVRNASVCIDKAHGQSIWNVHLEPWKSEKEFWSLYAAKYAVLIEKARAFLRMHTERLGSTPNGPPPKAAIFISAGFDASEWEGAGMQRHQVNVPTEFYAKFTGDVVRMANEEGLGTDGRVISILEGGYSDRALTSGVLSHLSGLSDWEDADSADEQSIDRLASEMTDRLGLSDPAPMARSTPMYDREWWSPGMLEELEALAHQPAAPIKPREKSAPTYFAPTQSFSAKVVNPSRDRKSTGSHSSMELEAAPPPPPPSVDWATATHELSRVLIPTHRQTTSCRPEELNAEASRLRRERHTGTVTASPEPSSMAPDESRMKLRVRKPKPSLPVSPKPEAPKRPVPSVNRRTTIDTAPEAPGLPTEQPPGVHSTRRKSAGAASVVMATAEPAQPTKETIPRPSSSATITARKSTSRSSTPKLSSPRNAPPVPQVPTAFLPARSAENPSSENLPPADDSGAQDDVDNLAAGVRKLHIKLNVPSPEENAARERARRAAEERKRAASRVGSRPPSVSKKPGGRTVQASSKVTSRSAGSAQAKSLPGASVTAQTREFETIHDGRPPSSLATPVTLSPPPVIGKGLEGSSAESGWNRSGETDKPAFVIASPPLTPRSGPDGSHPQSALYAPAMTTQARAGLPVMMSSGLIPFARAPVPGMHDAHRPERQGEDEV